MLYFQYTPVLRICVSEKVRRTKKTVVFAPPASFSWTNWEVFTNGTGRAFRTELGGLSERNWEADRDAHRRNSKNDVLDCYISSSKVSRKSFGVFTGMTDSL